MRHNSMFEIPRKDSSDYIDLTLAVRRSARIHDSGQLSLNVLGIASAAVRGAPEALTAGGSGEGYRRPARLGREIVIVRKFSRVSD
jgi:hypothetical protein